MTQEELNRLKIGDLIVWDMNNPLFDETEEGYIETYLQEWHLQYPDRIHLISEKKLFGL